MQPSEILDALMGGSSSQSLQASIEELSKRDRRELLCTVCCLREEIADNCLERAEEVELMLATNGHMLPPHQCGIPVANLGVCLLVGAAGPSIEHIENEERPSL